jgi:hypothetical protein
MAAQDTDRGHGPLTARQHHGSSGEIRRGERHLHHLGTGRVAVGN